MVQKPSLTFPTRSRGARAKSIGLQRCIVVLALALTNPVRGAPPATEVVEAFIGAYNAHDVDRMLTMVTDDIRWMSVDGIRIRLQAAGKEALAAGMSDYFANLPSVRAEIRDLQPLQDFVTVIEAAHWNADGERHVQCAVSVYQLTEGQIKNVWYYPARPCEDGDEATVGGAAL